MLISLITEIKVGVSSYPTFREYRSIYSITGTVMQLGQEINATVQLYSKATNQLLDSVETNKGGIYIFKSLQKSKSYFVVAHHPKSQYNAVIQDNVVPK